MVSPEIEKAFAEYAVLAGVEAELRGLLYWYAQYQATHTDPPDPTRALWHLDALIHHADTLFGLRRPDSHEGALFRAISGIGRQDLVDVLAVALQAPATQRGRPLRAVMRRVRNARAHKRFDIRHQGDAFLLQGLGPGATAFEGLTQATQRVLASIEERKLSLMSRFVITRTVGQLSTYMRTTSRRRPSRRKSP